jgi:hypothetical protein
MLRRLSVHAAGAEEPQDTYVWENLKARTFEEGASRDFNHITDALREYALAGALHLEHFSSIPESGQYGLLKRRVQSELAQSLAELPNVVAEGFDRLLRQHAKEWSAFTEELGEGSFVRKWIDTAQ